MLTKTRVATIAEDGWNDSSEEMGAEVQDSVDLASLASIQGGNCIGRYRQAEKLTTIALL